MEIRHELNDDDDTTTTTSTTTNNNIKARNTGMNVYQK